MNNQHFNGEVMLLLEQIDKRYAALREADQEAIRVLAADVRDKFIGFPAEYARKAELEQIRDTAIRLERDSISRDVYEERHSALAEDMQRRLPRETFDSALSEWTTWRQSIDRSMNVALGQAAGAGASWRQLLIVLSGASLLIGLIVSLVVLFANNSI